MATRILLVSDVRLYVEGITRLLRDEPEIDTAGVVSTVHDALKAIAELNPNVVIVDLAMKESLSVIRGIGAYDEQIKIVALAVSEIESEILACAEAGAVGYVTRDNSVKDLIACVKAASMGELYCSPTIAASLMRRVSALAGADSKAHSPASFTRRECRVFEILHLPNKEIARELNIEVSTVKNHVHHILEKLGVHNRTQAISHFYESGAVK